jgi:hypothetical protein
MILIAPLQGGVELMCVVFPIIAISLTLSPTSFSHTCPKSSVDYVNLHAAYFCRHVAGFIDPF